MSGIASLLREHVLDLVGTGFVGLNLELMAVFPAYSTVPFHCIWIAVTVLYGVRSWGHLPTDLVLVVVSLATGGLLWHLAAAGAVAGEEVTEAPLMAVVFLAMVWHIRRRQSALELAVRCAQDERALREIQQQLASKASHDIRNPLTVARGYAELIRMRAADPGIREDSELVVHEVDRAAAIATRFRERQAVAAAETPD